MIFTRAAAVCFFRGNKGNIRAAGELVSGEKMRMKGGREGLKNRLDLEINSVFSISRNKQISLI